MNSQREKASAQASRQNKSQKQGQASKSKTNASLNNNNNNSNRMIMSVPIKTVRGRGGFIEDTKEFFTKPRGASGKSLTNRIFSGAGGALSNAMGLGDMGTEAGSWLSKVLGFGKYEVTKNSLLNKSSVENMGYVRRPPSFGSTSTGSDIEFCHCEYIGDVLSNEGFGTVQYVNNPGNPVAFPFLSQIAQYYELFAWEGLIYQYKSTSSLATGTTSGAMGTIVLGTDYDCVDSAFTDKRVMENSEYASNAAPYETFLHPIECSRKRTVLSEMSYVLPGVTTVSEANSVNGYTTDPRLYIPSVTTVASAANATTGQALGEVWVTYHVRLSRPLLSTLGGSTTYSQHIYLTSDDTNSNTLLVTNSSSNSPGFTPSLVALNTLTLTGSPSTVGRYEIIIVESYNSSTVVTAHNLVYSNVTPAVYHGDFISSKSVDNGRCAHYHVVDTSPGALFTFTLSTGSSSASKKVDIFITDISTSLTTRRKLGVPKVNDDQNERFRLLEQQIHDLKINRIEDYGLVPLATPLKK